MLLSSAPIGSEIFAGICLIVISLAVILVLRYYLPLRTTPAYILVPIFFALALPTSIVLLVPIDLASNAGTDDGTRGIWLQERALLVSWRITYWLTFGLTWFILPILAEFSDAGHRDVQAKLMYSLRSNAKYQAMVFGSGILGLIYVFISAGVTPTSLKALIMALAYVWGLILAIYLMGHGLVAIPRSLFRKADISESLRRIQASAPKIHESMDDSIERLEVLEAQVTLLSQRKSGTAMHFQEWIEELGDLCNLPESRPRTTSRRMSIPAVSVPTVITENYLADLTRSLTRARHKRIRYMDEWDRLVQNSVATQAILDSAASKKLEIAASSPRASFFERLTLFTPYTRYLYYYHMVPYMRILFGGLLSLASVCIVWSEVIKLVSSNLSVISRTVVHHPNSDRGQIGFLGQMIAAGWIFYMCAAALTSMTEVKVWRGRALVRRNTGYESAFWYAMQVARLSVPLSYNFMTFLTPDVYEETVFYKFLGKLINLTPLGMGFDYLFPIFILIPVSATLFNLYGKAKRMLGFSHDDESDDNENVTGYGTGGGWREGRDLIEREVGGSASLAHLRNPRVGAGNSSNGPAIAASNLASRSTAASRVNSSVRPHVNETGDEGFFGSFGHRVRNTIDTIETPEWIQGLSEGIKKPKWMGGDGESGHSRGEGSVTRLFGGGGQDGRVRL
ncbi:hypothetical protein VC83_05196 [Pseudogymnoascus destructans]|uniref:Uncharacterized protein n=2 Tax=Pseudogymnoascus destructans TaxID=655981 RepID=L8G1R0_PSED2|nr:uncharacterized protein VC83_05196 [Pseudogymnoascus destructans]ELR06739.1 hypothetical protein GMDG_00356 [Pseudogymnoascus destructans 20631-21]OAF58048.1 hypothetical protein VC83_05196 [Pseudogymnoascus destructans]